jgi:hypothetical protein
MAARHIGPPVDLRPLGGQFAATDRAEHGDEAARMTPDRGGDVTRRCPSPAPLPAVTVCHELDAILKSCRQRLEWSGKAVVRSTPVGAAMVGAFIVGGIQGHAHAQDRFSTEAWLAPRSVEDGTRRRMLDDLLARHLRVGMTRAEVKALLGTDGAGDAPTADPTLSYLIDRGLGDYWILLVTFGRDGRVTRVEEIQG